MRPAGVIRRAALQTAWDLALERATSAVPGATSRDIVASLVPKGYGREAVRNTVKNLTRSGALRSVGRVSLAGSMRPLEVLVPAQYMPTPEPDAGRALAGALRGWGR